MPIHSMGKATARLLAADGRTLALVGRNAARLATAKREIETETSARVETIIADITDRAAVADLAARIEAEPRPIDRLVNAAGTFFPKPFLEHEGDDYDSYADLNRGTFFITQAVARNMARHAVGRS